MKTLFVYGNVRKLQNRPTSHKEISHDQIALFCRSCQPIFRDH